MTIDLEAALASIKMDTLNMYTLYFTKRKIGSTTSANYMRESLKALDIYIGILEYYTNIDESLSAITEDEIKNVVEAAVTLIKTYNSIYYE